MAEQLNKLLDLFAAQAGANRQRGQQARNYMFDEFSKGVSSFNNEDVQYNYDKINEYYNDNVSNMSSEEIDMYGMLKDKYNRQIKQNNEFEVDNQRRYSFGKEIYDFADEYSNADNVRNFSYKTSKINEKGEMVYEDHFVELPNAEDYEGGESNPQFRLDNDKAIADLGGIDAYIKKREDYKRYLKNEAQKQIGSYAEYQDKMIKNYGASGRLTNYHLNEFAQIDEAYGFIIDSLEDDGLFDAEERDAYKSSILQKSSNPIKQFITRDNEIKDIRRKALLTEMQLLEQQGDIYEQHGTAAMNAIDMTDEANLNATGIQLEKDNIYNLTGDVWNISNKDIKEAMINPSQAVPEVVKYINSITPNLENVKKELKVKDASYIKNDGGSFLAGMEEETWSSDLYEEPTGYLPTIYGDKKEKEIIKEEDVVEKTDKQIINENKKASEQNKKTKGNLIEIDYNDQLNVSRSSGGVWLKPEGSDKQIFIRDDQLKEYQNPTIQSTDDLRNAVFNKENLPIMLGREAGFLKGGKTEFPKGSSLDAFLDFYNPKMKSQLKTLIFAFWKAQEKKDRASTAKANRIGQQIESIITKENINFPKIK